MSYHRLKGVDTIFKVGGLCDNCVRSVRKILILLYQEPLKSAISSNYFPNLLAI